MLVKTIVAVGLILVVAGEANAVTLATGPLRLAAGGELACSVVNVGTSPVMVTINAAVQDAEPAANGPLFIVPGQTESVLAANEETTTGTGHCSFGVTGRVANIRASGCTLDEDDDCLAILPAQ